MLSMQSFVSTLYMIKYGKGILLSTTDIIADILWMQRCFYVQMPTESLAYFRALYKPTLVEI